MKKLLLVPNSLLLAALFTANISAREGGAETTIPLTGNPHISHGMDRETVRTMFGAPNAQLAPDVWVYFDFKFVNAVVSRMQNSGTVKRQDTLVVAFRNGRVSVIRACDSGAVRALIAAQRKGQTPGSVVAAK